MEYLVVALIGFAFIGYMIYTVFIEESEWSKQMNKILETSDKYRKETLNEEK